jgi:hypothetical protein
MNKLSLVTTIALAGSLATLGCGAESAPSAAAAEATSRADPAPEQPGEPAPVCGPQSPRDISAPAGANTVAVPAGPTPHLCNVHFHDPFEHSGFAAVPQVTGEPGESVCKSVDVGDRVEFHWVYTNCEPRSQPVQGLANCVCDRDDLTLRVFAQAYVVDAGGAAPGQPTGELVRYAGSTTGPSYDNDTCSPARVNWEVAPGVERLSKGALASWCADNPWLGEDHPHQARQLVTDPAWLSAM